MKIIIASSFTPFAQGGATVIVDSLADAIRAQGHRVEVLALPFHPQPEALLEQMLSFRLIDLSQHGDQLIALRPPSYLLRHPNKVVWFIHHHRGAYDLWGTRYQDIPNSPEGLRIRDSIIHADNVALREAKRLYCNSQVMADRLRRFNGLEAEVLYPPLAQPERYYQDGQGDYILCVSRLVHHKRQWLAIDALRHTQTPVRLVLVGQPDPEGDSYARQLAAMSQEGGLGGRVRITSNWIPESEKVELFAQCLAVIYMPVDEDSYGYPTLEALQAGKPVITCSDSGGTRELIVDGETGLVTAPDPEAIAQAMDRLYQDRAGAARMGEAGRQRIAELGIGWDKVLRSLLA